MKSWFQIDGSLPAIDYDGDSSYRFPEALVEGMLNEYTRPGDRVLDPFCGFGTTLAVCARLGRPAVGFERNLRVFQYACRLLASSNRVFHDRADNICTYNLDKFDFVICSPPFRSFDDHIPLEGEEYYSHLVDVFRHIRRVLRLGAHIVVETANLASCHSTIPRAFRSMLALAELFTFEREYVCCNTGEAQVAPGYYHSYLMVFRNE